MKWCLFGAGVYGQIFLEEFSETCNITCFCDSSEKKQGAMFKGLPVISPVELAERKNEFNVIVASASILDIIYSLFIHGIKKSYIYNPLDRGTGNLTLIDLSAYDTFEVIPNKVALISPGMSGSNCSALKKLSNEDDLEFAPLFSKRITSEMVAEIFTSAMLVMTHHQWCSIKKSIMLWHGFPIKALGDAQPDRLNNKEWTGDLGFIHHTIQASYSELYSALMGYSYGVHPGRFKITGMPRNDFLFVSDGHMKLQEVIGDTGNKTMTLYAPTFRESIYYNGQQDGDPAGLIFGMQGFNWRQLDNFLEENDTLMLIKLHPHERIKIPDDGFSNIKQIDDNMFMEKGIDFYEILNAVDLLITDYSSIYFDYLLLNRPIIFTPVDIIEYRKARRLLLEPYDDWTPGEKATDFPALLKAISSAIKNPAAYEIERKRMTRIIHAYADGHSTERVIKLIKDLLEQE